MGCYSNIKKKLCMKNKFSFELTQLTVLLFFQWDYDTIFAKGTIITWDIVKDSNYKLYFNEEKI